MNEYLVIAPGRESAELDRDYGRDEIRSIDILENRQNIHPLAPEYEYASVPFDEAFDVNDIYDKIVAEFGEVLTVDPEDGLLKLAIFAFYSRPNQNLDSSARQELDIADILAFLEARRAKPDDFLYYYRGEPDSNGNVMSFCVWSNFEESHSVRTGPFHIESAKLAKKTYDTAHVQGHTMIPSDDSRVVTLKPEFEYPLAVGSSKAA
jgi:hypothetical protein